MIKDTRKIINSLDVNVLRKDLEDYLNTHTSVGKVGTSFVVSGENTQTYEEKKITIQDLDDIQILDLTISQQYIVKEEMTILCCVRVGIGKLDFNSAFYTVGYCIAELLYNEESQLVTVDFYFDPIRNKESA